MKIWKIVEITAGCFFWFRVLITSHGSEWTFNFIFSDKLMTTPLAQIFGVSRLCGGKILSPLLRGSAIVWGFWWNFYASVFCIKWEIVWVSQSKNSLNINCNYYYLLKYSLASRKREILFLMLWGSYLILFTVLYLGIPFPGRAWGSCVVPGIESGSATCKKAPYSLYYCSDLK